MVEDDCTKCGQEDELRCLDLETTIAQHSEIAQLCPSCCRQLIKDLHPAVENPLEYVGFAG